jgi:hypothetical protein
MADGTDTGMSVGSCRSDDRGVADSAPLCRWSVSIPPPAERPDG